MSSKKITVPEAAAQKGVSTKAIYQAIRDGRIPSIREYGRIVVKESDIDAYQPIPNDQRKGIRMGGRQPKEQTAKRPRGRPRKTQETQQP